MGQDSAQPGSQPKNLPKWLDVSVHEYESTLAQIEAQYILVLEARDKQDPNLYSNAHLHAEIKKEQQCKDTLSKLNDEKARYAKELKENQDIWAKRQVESFAKISELSSLRSKLILDLITWQNKSKESIAAYAKAEKEFQIVKERIERKKIQDDVVALTEEYKNFLETYGKVLSLARSKVAGKPESVYFDQCKSTIPLPLTSTVDKIPAYAELVKKTPEELKALAELTQDKELLQRAIAFESEQATHEESQRQFFLNSPKELKRVNLEEFGKLILDAGSLASEYLDAAEKKKKEAKAEYDAIEKEEQELLAQVLAATNAESAINKAHREYSEAQKRLPKKPQRPDLETLSVMVQAYDNLKDQLAATLQFNVRKKKADISKRYKDAGEKFGVYRLEKLMAFNKNAKEAFEQFDNMTDSAREVIKDNIKHIGNDKVDLVVEKLLQLIKSAVENNTAFWNRQISFFGSGYQINGVKVPHGIAKLHPAFKHISICRDSEGALSMLQKIVRLRIAAGTGFFAWRTLSTTDAFYHIIDKINKTTIIEKIRAGKTPDDIVGDVIKDLEKIKDDKGGLALVDVSGIVKSSIVRPASPAKVIALPPMQKMPELEGMPELQVKSVKP